MFEAHLDKLRSVGLLRSVLDRASAQGARVTIGDRQYANFASNDYLGLAANPALRAAAEEALRRFGTGGGASRLLAGGTEVHAELERATAGLKGTEDALLLNSGYAANTGVIPAIAGEGDAVFSDELNHASIIDGCRLSRAKVHVYPHADVKALASLLGKSKGRNNIVVTDSVFSMHGDIAPIDGLYKICEKHGALLYIDDAHATGVLGGGSGSLRRFDLDPEPWIIQMGTYSKALGSFGAFVAGSAETVDWIRNRARSFIFSTALPAPVAAASLAAVKLVQKEPGHLERLWCNRELMAEALKKSGIGTGGSETPIIPVAMRDVQQALRCAGRLLEEGIYAPAIRPPTVAEPIIRLTVTAAHTGEDIGLAAGALAEAMA